MCVCASDLSPPNTHAFMSTVSDHVHKSTVSTRILTCSDLVNLTEVSKFQNMRARVNDTKAMIFLENYSSELDVLECDGRA